MDEFVSFVKSTVTAVGEELKHATSQIADADLGIHHITRRILSLGFPYDDSAQSGGATIALPVSASQASSGVSVRQLSQYLRRNYPDRFMVWNLSEKTYDYSLLDNQVIEFRFPGSPAPPLNQVFALCNSIHAWLQADDANVAVVHCLSGRGRTLCALAWYLAWSGEFASVEQAVTHVARRLGASPVELMIPTQTRYLSYLTTMLTGTRPRTRPLLLERIIMNGIPRFGERRADAPDAAPQEACRPYLQIFRDAQLVYTSTGRDSTELRWYTADDSILFPVGLELSGDLLVRVRHLSADNRRVSMLRFGLHTGFLSAGNTRLAKSDLDGAALDRRFASDFWLDLVFREPDEAVETEAMREADRTQQQYWEQVNSARRQAKADSEAAAKRRGTKAASSSPPAATATNATSSARPAATATAAAAKFSSLFSSASSKLNFSLFGVGSDGTPVVPPEDDAEVAKMRALDEAAIRKARRAAATQAAVAAALAGSPQKTMPASSAPRPTPLGADPDGFADLQAYVSGLGNLDHDATEVDSDQEEARANHREVQLQHASDDMDLQRAMEQHFDEADQADADEAARLAKSKRGASTTPPPQQPSDINSTTIDDDFFSSMGLPTSPIAATDTTDAAAPRAAATGSVATDDLDLMTRETRADSLDVDAALEAELAAMRVEDIDGDAIDFDAMGEDGEIVLDDADEAALLASLQDELDTQ